MIRWLAVALAVLYLFQLDGAGLLSADEPRYAAVGREMASSGDWITPRLWGDPWFEKPPLLYWMVAAGFRLGLNEDLAPRLPVALISLAFLAFFWWILRREYGPNAAFYSTAILATSAGWLGFSYVAVTDLPLAAFFSAAMLLAMSWLRNSGTRAPISAAALLGLAVLAKGLVPLVLALPLVWVARKRLRDLLHPAPLAAFLAVAAPWYLLCYLRNGMPFLREFFLEHHFGRFVSDSMQHVQPFWYYIPVFAAALFPWTTAAPLLFRPTGLSDPRRQLLLLWLVFGMLFFSASTNKLPGYILPLLPAAAALLGLAFDESRHARWMLAPVALLLAVVFPLAGILPQAIATGLSRASYPAPHWTWLLPLLLAIPVWHFETSGQRPRAVALLAAGAIAAAFYLKVSALPAMDQAASARPLWRRIAPVHDTVCVEAIHRNWRYGLNYYSITPLPDCDQDERPLHVVPGNPPMLVPQ